MSRKEPVPVVDEHGAADFSRLTTIPAAEDLIDIAFRRGRKAQSPKGAPGEAGRNRELARVGTASGAMEARLHRVVREFPSIDDLHPFYRELVDVVVGTDALKQSLGAVGWARERIQEVRADAEDRIRAAENDHEMMLARKEAYGRFASITEQVAEDLERISTARYELAGLPTLMFDRPVLVVAGFPNVGKSSFLRHVTRATPEVAPYPFTTKGVSLGHAEHGHHLVQIMDTPGLLDRPLEERNDIERQAILALSHAGDAILFILDPSGHCGYPLEEQLGLLEEVEELFGELPLLVVENKSDLKATGERPAMSCENEEGITEIAEQALETAVDGFRERTRVAWEAADDEDPADLDQGA